MSYEPGTTYGNRYTLMDRIAVGGMGEVWRATDGVLGRVVAIKLLGAHLASQPGFAQRFREEARHTARLGHPNIAQVHDYGEDDGASWLVMELVAGKPLSTILREHGPLSIERTVSIVAQAADALQAAHDHGVIHRDVKPANIMIRPDGVVKLTDFGIARATDAAPLTRTGEVMGTAQYISPEQAMGLPVGPTSDIYSLACVAYEMLAGRRVFDEGSAVGTAMAHVHKVPPPLPASVPHSVASVIMGALSKDPAHRPPTAKDMASSLRGLPGATYRPTQVFPVTPPPQATERLGSPTGYAAGVGAGMGAQASGYNGPPAYPGTGGYPQQPPPGKRNRAVWMIPLIVVLLGLLAWALIASKVFGSDTPTPSPSRTVTSRTASRTASPTTSPRPATTNVITPTPATVSIKADDYVGEDVDGVRKTLEDLGLIVKTEPVASDQPIGEVLDLTPTGSTIPVGTTIILRVSRGPDPTTGSSSPADSGTTDNSGTYNSTDQGGGTGATSRRP